MVIVLLLVGAALILALLAIYYELSSIGKDTSENISFALTTGFIGTVISLLISPIIKERFKVREGYFAPFTRWSIRFSGALNEFEEVCREIREEKVPREIIENMKCLEHGRDIPLIPLSRRSNSDLVYHFWYFHREVEEGYNWIEMFRKNDRDGTAEWLDNILDEVDRIWHRVELDYIDILTSQNSSKEIRAAMQTLHRSDNLAKLADFIKCRIALGVDEDGPFYCQKFATIKKSLENTIPRRDRPLS